MHTWYTSSDFQEANKLLGNRCPQLEEGINSEAMGLKWYQGLLLPHTCYPGMGDHSNANPLRTVSPSIVPANHGIPPADHEIPVPPSSPDKSKMCPPPTSSNKGKEKENDVSNIGGLLMDLAKDGSEDGTSTPAENDASTKPPAPTGKEAGTTRAAPTKTVASTTLAAPTGQDAGTTPEKPTHSKQQDTLMPDWPATPSSDRRSSDDDNSTEDEEYMSCFIEWLGLDSNCKIMLDDETKMSAHHEQTMGNKAIHIFQYTVNTDPCS